MTPITNCKVEFAFKCPKRWSKLKKTKDHSVRFCDVCSRNVHLCNTLEDVHWHASRGDCIAVPPKHPDADFLMGEPMRDPEIPFPPIPPSLS